MQKGKQTPQIISWEAPEFVHSPKDASWYFAGSALAVLFALIAVWQGNFLFVVFILVAWVVVIAFAEQKPVMWHFTLNEKGLEFREASGASPVKFYAYRDLAGFDMHEIDTEYDELWLRVQGRFVPYIRMRIPRTRKEEVVQFLSEIIRRQEYQESLADSLAKMIRF